MHDTAPTTNPAEALADDTRPLGSITTSALIVTLVPVVMPARRVSFIVLVFIVAAIDFVSARAVTVIAAGTIVATCFGRARS